MFYRRKYYIVKNEFVEIFNTHFMETNLPNQIKHGSRLVGRWMIQHDESTTEIFAIWEYDSYEKYKEIEIKIRGNKEHMDKVKKWYKKNGGREKVRDYILKVKNEEIFSTLQNNSESIATNHEIHFWNNH